MAQGFNSSGDLGAKLGDLFKKAGKKRRKAEEDEFEE
jgi:hypothetical protein